MPNQIAFETELNAEQLAVVQQADGPCLVLAGAGSGKTRTITYRVAYLIERGVDPSHILLVTFTNKAAREMIERVERLLGGYPHGLWAGTFHSIANRLLRQHAHAVGFTPAFTILDQDDSRTLLKACIKDIVRDMDSKRFPSPAVLQSLISYARNAQKPLREVIEHKGAALRVVSSLIEQITDAYAERKKRANSMDFDDLLLILLDLFERQPVLRDAIASQYEYVLVDEYQDTNSVQAKLIAHFSRIHRNVLVVGDDAQSIYSFRAAEIRNILGFPDQFSGAKVFHLLTNYRSCPPILSLANASIRNNEAQFEKNLVPMREGGGRPVVMSLGTAQEEARYVVRRVRELLRGGIKLADVAVLMRAAHQSQALELLLMKEDLPYEVRGGLKFFERAHIKDAMAYLRVLRQPRDEVSWLRILGHQAGIGLATAEQIVELVRSQEDLSAMLGSVAPRVPARGQNGWRVLMRLLRDLASQTEPGHMLRMLARSEYQDYLQAEYPDAAERLEDIEALAAFADQYQDLASCVDELSLQDETGVPGRSASTDRLILSTIHQAKGLEWEAVFVIHMHQNAFPHPRAFEEPNGLEEERRLFYVASTRAKTHLTFTYPLLAGFESLSVQAPSLFLQELPPALLEASRATAPSAGTAWGTLEAEPVIVLDEQGERKVPTPTRRSFLRSVDEL